MSAAKKDKPGRCGTDNNNWKGGNNPMWYRQVAEKKIGRPLEEDEVVHHEDENRHNNDPSNLRVFASQGDHLRYHAWLKAGRKKMEDFA